MMAARMQKQQYDNNREPLWIYSFILDQEPEVFQPQALLLLAGRVFRPLWMLSRHPITVGSRICGADCKTVWLQGGMFRGENSSGFPAFPFPVNLDGDDVDHKKA